MSFTTTTAQRRRPQADDSKRRVTYHFDADVCVNANYGQSHPMKPQLRLQMTHSLALNYGLFRKMQVLRSHAPASTAELRRYHSKEYVEFLRDASATSATTNNKARFQQHNINGTDCPLFDGLFEHCSRQVGLTLDAAVQLNRQRADVAINWAGGMHHAKRGEASGFCYVNDVVIGILELLKYHSRVLYVDIDVHHGDGVEEAFESSDRCMTVSFHQYGAAYFPGSGALRDVGHGKGTFYALNCPLKPGIGDDAYVDLFDAIVTAAVERYRPEAIVMQCGADSLARDPLGSFNLTLRSHGACVEIVKRFCLPLMLLGGGGYSVANTARAWTNNTALAIGGDESLAVDIPVVDDYYDYYGPSYALSVRRRRNTSDENTQEWLGRIKTKLLQNLRELPAAPSVPMRKRAEDETRSITLENRCRDEDERIPDAQRERIVEHSGGGDLLDRAEGGEASGNRNNNSTRHSSAKRLRLDATATQGEMTAATSSSVLSPRK